MDGHVVTYFRALPSSPQSAKGSPMRHRNLSRIIILGLAALLTACQAGNAASPGISQAPDASAGTTAAASASTASAIPTAVGTPPLSSLPVVMPRPTDVPTDGTCEAGDTCFGLLESGKQYTTSNFQTPISFSVPEAGWENLSEKILEMILLPIAEPGDAIAFFGNVRAVDINGYLATGDGNSSVNELAAWMAANPNLSVTKAKAVTIGGLSGLTLDFTIAPGLKHHPFDCPIQVCLAIFRGTDNHTMTWDWGSAGPEKQRVYLLTSSQGTIAIFVDSLDGTTFDSLTQKADQILATVTFH